MSLPPELWWIVIELIASKAELCVLTRVCTFLRYSAVRQLYHTVMFEKLAPFIKFARCIIGISTLGGYTTKLTFRVFDTHVPGFYFALTFSKLLRSTLQNMTRLRHLSLYWGARFLSRRGRETRSDFFCSGMFDRCTFRLQTFSSNAILDKHLFLFLRCQREIWRISLERPFPGGTIPPSLNIAEILPRLAVLQTGEREVVHLLMHNRSVTHVQLAERIRPSEELIFSLSYSLGPVKAFYYNHTTVDSGALRALPLAAPYLQHITVAIFSADSMDSFASVLLHFHNLMEVCVDRNYYVDLEPEENVLATLHKMCPSLQVVHITSPYLDTRSRWIWKDGSWVGDSRIMDGATLWEDSIARAVGNDLGEIAGRFNM